MLGFDVDLPSLLIAAKVLVAWAAVSVLLGLVIGKMFGLNELRGSELDETRWTHSPWFSEEDRSRARMRFEREFRRVKR